MDEDRLAEALERLHQAEKRILILEELAIVTIAGLLQASPKAEIDIRAALETAAEDQKIDADPFAAAMLSHVVNRLTR
jgi:hypothetical protein